jgi:hypothetical protein
MWRYRLLSQEALEPQEKDRAVTTALFLEFLVTTFTTEQLTVPLSWRWKWYVPSKRQKSIIHLLCAATQNMFFLNTEKFLKNK